MATSIGSGLGGFAAVAQQPTYGATFVTPTRTLMFKSAKTTYDPHIVQGGPYLQGGHTVDFGTAHIQTWLDASGTLMGDVCNSSHALLFATSLASTATLTALGTTTAYELGGASGASMGVADTNGSYIDMQLGVPTSDGVQRPENYHSCVITKAEWVFDRSGIVTYSYDFNAQYVEKTTTLITPTYTTAPVPFAMNTTSSVFKAGTYGSEAAIDGVKKVTFTLERPMATERIYLGNQYKDAPVTNALVKLGMAMEVDYTTAAKTGLFDIFLAGTSLSVVATAVGAAIGSSGYNNTFGLNMTNAFVQTGGESPLDGPDIVHNTINWTGTVDAANDPALKGTLITADTSF